ncbi:hypothetical protein [Winogradskyella helgolandensis]|uniref:hypothetical protein n=1 Tax=Winogradskyella helgolandensis TaxID=2697010 RepID=UPI0015C03641|nr:hypothetical protein [Winogradskyella helgolandensis]
MSEETKITIEKSQYKSLADWRYNCEYEYHVAEENDWLNELCKIFGWKNTIWEYDENYGQIYYDFKLACYVDKEGCSLAYTPEDKA